MTSPFRDDERPLALPSWSWRRLGALACVGAVPWLLAAAAIWWRYGR